MTTILELSGEQARQYFLMPNVYCTLILPGYFDFSPVLDYVKGIVNNKGMDELLMDSKIYPSQYEGVNHMIMTNKDGKYSYRIQQIANPFLYYLIVRTITEPENWKQIKTRFNAFKKETIEVSSIPMYNTQKTDKAVSITSWRESYEKRSIEMSLEYRYMFMTDLSNCYPSIYTHAIEWAIEGKESAKNKRGKKNSSLGHILDRYIQGLQYGQTNGIPQGSVLFDFIAEIVLGYADLLLFDKLEIKRHLGDYKILRYRDDYRIFSNSREELESIVIELNAVLAGLNFQMNASKTRLSESIVADSIKPDKFFYISNIPMMKGKRSRISNIIEELYYILSISKQYPNSSILIKLMDNMLHRIEKCDKISDPVVLASIITEIAFENPRVYQQAIACISVIINGMTEIASKNMLQRSVQSKMNRLPNIGDIQIWMQRIFMDDNYTEPLCQLVLGQDVKIWNCDWLNINIRNDIPYDKIIDRVILNSMMPTIHSSEIKVFDY